MDNSGSERSGWIGEFSDRMLSIAAVFISVLSLWFTVSAQNVDREYKELSIRPVISVTGSPDQLTMGIRNDGIGPAVIKRVQYEFNGQCVSLNEGEQPFGAEARTILRSWAEALMSELRKGIDNDVANREISVGLLVPGQVFAIGETYTVFKLFEVEAYRAAFKKRDIKEPYTALRSANLPIVFEYCSLTGKACFMESGSLLPCANSLSTTGK